MKVNMNLNRNLSSFESKGIEIQDNAYMVSWARKKFEYSCELCCAQNRRPCGTCSQCPIKEAHVRACQEISSGKRAPRKKNPGYGTYVSRVKGEIKITLVMNFDVKGGE